MRILFTSLPKIKRAYFLHHLIFFFVFLLCITLTLLFFREWWKDKTIFVGIILFLSVIIVSHGIFDAMTSGGFGIPFLVLFDNSCFFFPVRLIVIGVSIIFSE